MKLAQCADCGYIGNQLFDPEKVAQGEEYALSLSSSSMFRRFLSALAKRLASRYKLDSKTVLEIGCGEGEFLREICKFGASGGYGIDPMARPRIEGANDCRVEFIRDRYSAKHRTLKVDFLCCRQVLDEVVEPRRMLELVRRHLLGRGQVPVYFEVPNAANIFESMQIRNVMYEKASWFTPDALANLFNICGFEVLSVEPCFHEGQYLGIEAMPMPARQWRRPGKRLPSGQFVRALEAFDSRYERKIRAWSRRFRELHATGKRIMAWGSGAGGIHFFSALGITSELVPYVVDINPKRQGKFLPLTGQLVVRPQRVRRFRPDMIVVTNATFVREIKRSVAEMGVTCDFWTL
ncbi:MAG: class I SAM-dependent methyltransferase [Betaproteobacteria bacterium]|nr:class I SAM-dependent methyltransferase [Betaproteobacteria bacterium]